tara:strand:+ start:166 stop:684 length:519 start_codon:yes stop_codon:yes gene_type:complete
MTVFIILTVAVTDAGPFDLYSNLDGYTVPFQIGVSKASLVAGYSSSVVPDFTSIIRVKSTGVCKNFSDFPILGVTTTTSTSSTSSSTTTTTTTSAVTNYLIQDCLTGDLYNVTPDYVKTIGEVIPYWIGFVGNGIRQCGTIISITFPGPADAVFGGAASYTCDDGVHCPTLI